MEKDEMQSNKQTTIFKEQEPWLKLTEKKKKDKMDKGSDQFVWGSLNKKKNAAHSPHYRKGHIVFS